MTISTRVTQPILRFGPSLEQGLGTDREKVFLVYDGNKIISIFYMENRNMTVIRAVRANVSECSSGWSVNYMGYLVGESVQDPTLVFPALTRWRKVMMMCGIS